MPPGARMGIGWLRVLAARGQLWHRSHMETQLRCSSTGSRPRILPPYARLPPPTEPLHEEDDLIWNDGVAPETLIDFDAPHISKWQALRHLVYAFLGIAGIMGIVMWYDPSSMRQAAPRGDHLPDLSWEEGLADAPSEEIE